MQCWYLMQHFEKYKFYPKTHDEQNIQLLNAWLNIPSNVNLTTFLAASPQSLTHLNFLQEVTFTPHFISCVPVCLIWAHVRTTDTCITSVWPLPLRWNLNYNLMRKHSRAVVLKWGSRFSNAWERLGLSQDQRALLASGKETPGMLLSIVHCTRPQCVRVCWVASAVSGSEALCTAAYQASLSMRFSRQEYCSGLQVPSSQWSSWPGDLPDPGIEPGSLELQADSLLSELPEKPMYRICH